MHLQPLPIELGLLCGERRFTGLVSQRRVAQLRLVRFKVALFFAQALCQFIVLFCKTKSAVGRAGPCRAVCVRARALATARTWISNPLKMLSSPLNPAQNEQTPFSPISWSITTRLLDFLRTYGRRQDIGDSIGRQHLSPHTAVGSGCTPVRGR